MKVKVEWDLDDLSLGEAGVTEIVAVPIGLTDHEVTDYLSDTYGWCVIGWEYLTKDEDQG